MKRAFLYSLFTALLCIGCITSVKTVNEIWIDENSVPRLDNNPLLTDLEAQFLNEYLKKHAQTMGFDFYNKRILFVTGSSGTTIGSKSDYFECVREWKSRNNQRIATFLVVLKESDRLEYGYDAIVTYWVKVLTPASARKALKKSKDLNL